MVLRFIDKMLYYLFSEGATNLVIEKENSRWKAEENQVDKI